MRLVNHSLREEQRSTASGQAGMSMWMNSTSKPEKLLKTGWHGPECEIKKKAVARFKYAVRYIKRNELTLRANALARGMQQNDVNDFWKEVKIMNHSKIPLPSSMEGVSGSVNIVELWRRHYMELFNCFKSDVVTAGDVSHDNVVIRPDDISHAIG